MALITSDCVPFRSGSLNPDPTRYIFCPDAQEIPIPAAQAAAKQPGRRSSEQAPDEVVMLHDDDDSAENAVAIAVSRAAGSSGAVRGAGKPVARAAGALPADAESDEPMRRGRRGWRQSAEPFSISLLVPSETDESTLSPSIDMVEIRCQVANVTKRRFTE